jgi:hypothetical protein
MDNNYENFSLVNMFKDLSAIEYNQARETVLTMFYGVASMWGPTVCVMPEEVREAKRKLCYDYLIGWQLLTLYPGKAAGIASMGGIPLAAKTIGDITIKYRDQEGVAEQGLDILTTNVFGMQALEMIQHAPDNFILYR